MLRYNADDDALSLGELVRQERFGAGSSDQKNLDAEMAVAIARDGKFEVSTTVSQIPRLTSDGIHRTISTTWTIMPIDWVRKR